MARRKRQQRRREAQASLRFRHFYAGLRVVGKGTIKNVVDLSRDHKPVEQLLKKPEF